MACAIRAGDGTKGDCDDGHKCCPHEREGRCRSGSANVLINGRGAISRGDIGLCKCPHHGMFYVKGGSSKVLVNGRELSYVGVKTRCIKCLKAGELVEGSENVQVGE